MELTVFILLGVIVVVALLTRRLAARRRDAQMNPTAPKPVVFDGTPKKQDPAE